jgi:hypothetical protein
MHRGESDKYNMRKITRERRTYERELFNQTKLRYLLQYGSNEEINRGIFNKMRE